MIFYSWLVNFWAKIISAQKLTRRIIRDYRSRSNKVISLPKANGQKQLTEIMLHDYL